MHFLYTRVELGEKVLRRLLTRGRGGVILTDQRPELIFHAYTPNLEAALGLTADMRALAQEILAAADDLETFAEGFDFTAEPAQ